MHSQAKLVKHLKSMRDIMVVQHSAYERDTANLPERGMCDANWLAGGDFDVADIVKAMIREQFNVLGVKYCGATYLYPIRTGWSSSGNAQGTLEEVAAGYSARLQTIDNWIAAAEHKLLVAVFRTALDQLCTGYSAYYMCNELRRAASVLTGDSYMCGYAKELAEKAQGVLDQYKPYAHKHSVWFDTDERGHAIRKAILNLCITELVRGTV